MEAYVWDSILTQPLFLNLAELKPSAGVMKFSLKVATAKLRSYNVTPTQSIREPVQLGKKYKNKYTILKSQILFDQNIVFKIAIIVQYYR